MAAGFDPVAWINTPRWQQSRLGLDRVRLLLDALGRPQDRLSFIHVAGTNGKGSTCAYIASVLREQGYRTGLFTSPFVERFEERIRVDGSDIAFDELRAVTEEVKRAAEAVEQETGDHPTEFELMLAVALLHFQRNRCQLVVLEVGLGGRLDATNVIDAPEVCVIAPIDLDHTAMLGDTVAEIAGEKAGIIKAGAAVAMGVQPKAAAAVIEARARSEGCSVRAVDESALASDGIGEGLPLRRFRYKGECFETRLLAAYQPLNAALAIEAIRALQSRGWAVEEAALSRGIAKTTWPGRFEVMMGKPLLIVDGGHNPQGARALALSLKDLLGEKAVGNVDFVMGVLADKDYGSMVEAVLDCARTFTVYAPGNPRALEAASLARVVRDRAVSAGRPDVTVREAASAADAVAFALRQAGEFAEAGAIEAAERPAAVVAFGSLYSLGDIKREVRRLAAEGLC